MAAMGQMWSYGISISLLILVDLSLANWMYLSMASVGISPQQQQPAASVDRCSAVPDMVMEQQRLCQENPQAMPCVGLGAKLGMYECQYQFLFERWNCTSPYLPQGGQSTALKKGTKEKAFVYAITSAGVVHAITRACSAGNLTDCSCDTSRQGLKTKEGWEWGGCSDNVDYGIWFTRTFLDAPERIKHSNQKDIRALMNLYNNEVGRQSVSQGMTLKCRCHGVSGSCAVKTCWNSMPSFRSIGQMLKEKYGSSVELESKKSKKKLARRNRRMRRKVGNKYDLVYVDKSPNYCKRNLKRGIAGTKGRECKRDSKGPDSCDKLCCGRGHNTKVERYMERCHCKFIWCCEVKCRTCQTVVEKYYCK